ncbi:MAG: MFS transporter [Actinobacteria bacterium]|nr:MFS transporter [Actinomycetota bacterium]
MRAEIDKRAMAALSSGHAATDFAGGALPALLPFFAERFDLSYTLAGLLMLASAFSSSVVQPFFGIWSDRRGGIWLLPTGVAIAGIGIALAADAPSYWLVVIFVLVSGVGVAAYHPEGSKFAAYTSGRKRASGMSLFSIGGNLGYALGAAAATPLVLWLGLRGGLLLAVPGLIVAGALFVLARYLAQFVPERDAARSLAGRDRPGALALLLGVIALRSTGWFGLVTFVPLWAVSQGHSKAYGNQLLTFMLLAGVAGTLAAGPLADRIGRRPVLIGSMAATGPFTLVFVAVGGVAGAVALGLVGACVIGTFGVTMVMSQEYLPQRIGLASGLSIGMSIGLGGIAAVGLGALADIIDLRTSLYVCAAVPLAAVALAAFLPGSRTPTRLAPELVSP